MHKTIPFAALALPLILAACGGSDGEKFDGYWVSTHGMGYKIEEAGTRVEYCSSFGRASILPGTVDGDFLTTRSDTLAYLEEDGQPVLSRKGAKYYKTDDLSKYGCAD